MNELKYCRNCQEWYTAKPFYGNCGKHPWEHDKPSQSATPSSMGCRDYVDRQMKLAIAKEA